MVIVSGFRNFNVLVVFKGSRVIVVMNSKVMLFVVMLRLIVVRNAFWLNVFGCGWNSISTITFVYVRCSYVVFFGLIWLNSLIEVVSLSWIIVIDSIVNVIFVFCVCMVFSEVRGRCSRLCENSG